MPSRPTFLQIFLAHFVFFSLFQHLCTATSDAPPDVIILANDTRISYSPERTDTSVWNTYVTPDDVSPPGITGVTSNSTQANASFKFQGTAFSIHVDRHKFSTDSATITLDGSAFKTSENVSASLTYDTTLVSMDDLDPSFDHTVVVQKSLDSDGKDDDKQWNILYVRFTPSNFTISTVSSSIAPPPPPSTASSAPSSASSSVPPNTSLSAPSTVSPPATSNASLSAPSTTSPSVLSTASLSAPSTASPSALLAAPPSAPVKTNKNAGLIIAGVLASAAGTSIIFLASIRVFRRRRRLASLYRASPLESSMSNPSPRVEPRHIGAPSIPHQLCISPSMLKLPSTVVLVPDDVWSWNPPSSPNASNQAEPPDSPSGKKVVHNTFAIFPDSPSDITYTENGMQSVHPWPTIPPPSYRSAVSEGS